MLCRPAMKRSTLNPTVHQMVTAATEGIAQSGSWNHEMLIPVREFKMPKLASRIQIAAVVTTLTGKTYGRKKAANTTSRRRFNRTTSSATKKSDYGVQDNSQ